MERRSDCQPVWARVPEAATRTCHWERTFSFRLNDIYFREFVPAAEQLLFLRFKERRFGRGCIDQWSGQRDALLAQLEARLQPFESMLVHRPFLLGDRPRFVDLDLASKIYC